MSFLIPEFLQEYAFNLITGYITNQLGYVWNYEDKVQELDEVVKKLIDDRDWVRDRAEEDEGRYGRAVYDHVIEWLAQVDELIPEYEEFKKDHEEHSRYPLAFPNPNLEKRYHNSKKAEGIKMKVAKLLEEKRNDISRWQGLFSEGVTFSNVDYEDFESRIETTDQIMEALKNPSARMIGVHGLAGVGKTTLIIEAAKKVLGQELFKMVIMVNVTKSPDIRKIQGQIADMLGMKLEEESEYGRAVRIKQRLKKEKENALIILDDLYAKVDLNMLGIPWQSDDGSQKNLILKERISSALVASTGVAKREKTSDGSSKSDKKGQRDTKKISNSSSKLKKEGAMITEEHHKECKVLLISELRQVLSQMDVKASLIFSVNVLDVKDAETLFKKMAGISDGNFELETLAVEIAKKCHRLPMSIVTTAKALKNQSHLVWQDTHRKLERENLTGTPEYSTKLSYDLLENEELKLSFLLCACMGHDALVADLVKYCIGLGFFPGIYTAREARERVQMLLVKLKESGLLSDSYSSDRFTMQNLVRHGALSIASKERHVFILTNRKLDEWPDEDRLERYTVISLQHCDVIEEFPESIKCPRLKIFHVDNNDPHLKVPNNFFQEMKVLRVLILIGIHLSPLPSSIRCLTKLRMLCLEQCILGMELCIIGELKNLRILSFSGSDIESLPIELKHLSKLQILDISNCSKLRMIPPDLISSLTSLEELYMRNTSIQWRIDEGQKSQSENVSLSELGLLNQLSNLDLQIPCAAHLPKDLFFDKLHSYKIVIGSSQRYLEPDFKIPEKYELSRFLAIREEDSFDIHFQKGIKMLFERVEILLLEKLNGVWDIFYALNLKGFPCLKHLAIVSNSSIQSLINPKRRKHHEKAFPKLESLLLNKLKNLEQICPCELLSTPSFGKLKIIKIKLCDRLKNVFSISIAGLLTALETIEISECNSLKEIILLETQNTDNTKCPVFPELRFLTLQSLPKFIGFYSVSPAKETKILFDQQVVISKLERMELSFMQIDQIWIDQSSVFKNLIYLGVNGCGNLKYLLSFSVARNLVNLQSLFVSECDKIRHIFRTQSSDANKKDSIFPNLKNIKLCSMKSLTAICDSKVSENSFVKLDTLIIDECDKLVNVVSCRLAGIIWNLSSLRVTNCKSMKAIFDLADQSQDARYETKLQDVHLETLPRLEHILKFKCEKGQEGILNLDSLQKIWVHDCDSLENIFPISVAKRLKKLEYLVVSDCFELKEIVAKGEDDNGSSKFEFPGLITIKFSRLPKFKSFYPGTYEFVCKALNDLSVECCDKLDPFGEETATVQRKHTFFPGEVINMLKSMQIESRHIRSSTSYDYRQDNLEELHLSKFKNTGILYSFLHNNPNLKSLWLNDCFFKELVPRERPVEIESLGVVPKLKNLTLTDLPHLEKIGFEQDAILQRIESLILKNCPSLDTIAPSSVSLTHLTNLEVVDCQYLTYLLSPSTAKSLGQLRNMKVINCASLMEIVSKKEEEEEEENATKVDIVFKQLKVLELVSLKNLGCFCNYKSCAFEFPSLDNFVVSACPKMENFVVSACPKIEVKCRPTLRKIYVVHDKEKERWCWKDNLQDTIHDMFKNKRFFEGMDEFSVSEHRDLELVWQGEEVARKDWFYSLKTLKLSDCKFEPYAIPSNVLRCLKSLKELEVRDCDNIRGIFEMNDTKIRGTSFQLKKLTLKGLWNVTHVWQQDKQGIPGFHNLQELTVYRCHKLNTLFPAALAKKLENLEKLEVKYCDHLQEIVKKQEVAAEATEKFVFPRLTMVALRYLPRLTHFYAERFTLECPELNYLKVYDCNGLELFQSEQGAHPEGQGSTSINKQPFFSDIKVISSVEKLYLDWKDTWMLKSRLGQSMNQDLRYLNKFCLFGDDENENSTLPFEIFQKTPNLETMKIKESNSLKEICFPSQNPEIGKGMLANLKQLTLSWLYELHSISGLEHLPKLQLFEVLACDCLTTLGGQSCSNLKELRIDWCIGLQCLFTSSAAKMLIHLEEMYVEECRSIKEIIVKEQDGTSTDTEEIRFERLERIHLERLWSLECFHSGNATLKFPSLIQVDIVDCPRMKIFSQGLIHMEPSRRIQISYGPDDDFFFHDDLNAAVLWSQLRMKRLVLAELKGIWPGIVPIPDDHSSCKLKYLELESCEFLSNAMLPSHLLPFLSNLEELVVRKCYCVEAIFDVKDTTTHDPNMIVIPLKRLTLKQLPTLRHIWNKDPKGSLNLPFLEEVTVNECESIKSLFPASVPKDKLTKLDVRNCVELVEIVAKDEAATETANKELIMFPRLTSLTLWDLPNLRCICSGKQILDWPVLKDLDVYHCQMLKIFATDFQDSPESYPEGRDHITTDKHGFVSVGKVVTPYFERLSLNKEDVIMIEKGLLHVNFEKVNFLRLQSFTDESDAFPDVFFSKVLLPSIEKFVLADSAFKEIFSSQRPDIDYTKNLSHRKKLELRSLQKLNSIGLEHSWMAPLLENLQGLRVLACSCLTNLALSTVFFIHLTELHVEDCARLEYLFTSSTAKSLVALKEISISNCESLKTVVAHEEGDKPNDEVIFEQLTTLSLSKLPKLGSFYAGKSTLNFPCLCDVSVTECKKLEYLFTSSTAKSLVKLWEMSISKCESLETVVAHEEGGKSDEDVTFPELRYLTLSELPKLGSFYAGKSTLNFPWLRHVWITQCKSMKTFSHSNVVARSVETVDIDGVNRSDDDLNTAVHQQFEKEAALSNEIAACSEKLTHIAFNHASLED